MDPVKKQEVRDALVQAVDRGVRAGIIAKDIDISPQSIHRFKEYGQLGKDKVLSVERWLKENGHWYGKGNKWALSAARLKSLAETLDDVSITDDAKIDAVLFEYGYLAGIFNPLLHNSGKRIVVKVEDIASS